LEQVHLLDATLIQLALQKVLELRYRLALLLDAYGQFFSPAESNPDMAVIGQTVATQIFGIQSPIGHSFSFRGQTFVVGGIFGQFATSPLSPVSNYNSTIFIPFGVGTQLSGGEPEIYEIYAKPSNVNNTDQVESAIKHTLLRERGGQTDFTVLEEKQDVAIANKTLNLITALIAGIAAISLIVGGIGIMNIMLVSVVERTHEIGIRKAVGATNYQIMMQFLIESGTIGLTGGVIGVIVSAIIDFFLGIFTSLRPAITLPIALLAVGIGLLAGIIFGVMPAMRAARKDPVKSLRHE
jgi:putative ABC transport system permease protein